MRYQTKENMLTAVRQFETNKAMGLPVDRTRRALLRRFGATKNARETYNELISSGELYETGDGSRGNPVTICLGPRPVSGDKPVVPQPWCFIEHIDLVDFIVRIHDVYEVKGWSLETLDIRTELKKALASYQPGRPY